MVYITLLHIFSTTKKWKNLGYIFYSWVFNVSLKWEVMIALTFLFLRIGEIITWFWFLSVHLLAQNQVPWQVAMQIRGLYPVKKNGTTRWIFHVIWYNLRWMQNLEPFKCKVGRQARRARTDKICRSAKLFVCFWRPWAFSCIIYIIYANPLIKVR
jgi:hypothetical protein